jgi:hypothetical protein
MGNKLSRQHMAAIGQKGGRSTKRLKGKKFFRDISKKRRHFRGGRPKKNSDESTQ